MATAEHRRIPARVWNMTSQLRREGLHSVWSPAVQSGHHVRAAEEGVVSLEVAPLVIPSFASVEFGSLFCDWW